MTRTGSRMGDDGVVSVAHGISLLGVEGALRSVLKLPTIDSFDQPQQRDGLTATLAKAHLAGEVASHFCPESLEKSRTGAHVQFLGELLGWQVVDKPAERFSAAWSRDAQNRQENERLQFGVSLMELSALAADVIGLSNMLTETADNKKSALAAQVANAVSLAWNSAETIALKAEAAQCFRVSTEVFDTELHRITAAAARSFPEPTAMHAARTLLLDEDQIPPSWYVAPAAVAVAPIEQCKGLLAAYVARETTVHQTFQSLVNTIHKTLGFKRVVVALLNKRQDRLVARFSSEDNDIYLTQFSVDLRPANLFSKLVEKPAGLMVDTTTLAKVHKQLPGTIQSLLPAQGFCVMSLFVGERPVGLMLAEISHDTDQEIYKQFKRICADLSDALEQTATALKTKTG